MPHEDMQIVTYGKCILFLQNMIPDMLQNLKDNRMGSPGYLGGDYVNEDGILVNGTCHAEWDKILNRMIFLWRESNEDTCSRKNPYEKKYLKAAAAFHRKYGILGEKLQTKEELADNKKHGGGGTVHSMSEFPEYAEILKLYNQEEQKLEEYRSECKDEALNLLRQHFFDLWD